MHCDIGSCLYPNPDGRFLSISQSSVVFDTRSDPSAMGFYVVAVELGRHTQLSISGWWSYSLPRTMAYVVSDKGFSALECSTGGGQTCTVSGLLSPGVYYLVFVDAWAQQTVVVEADGPIRLADVSAQRVACALWRSGVLRGQRLTYAFNWPSVPGVSISQDVDESSCGPPGLQEALAFAAAVGLNATEASLLVAPFGYNVTAVERRYGEAVFYLQPDLTYVVPLVYEVQLPNSGRLLLVNPSAVDVTWSVEVHFSNKTSFSGSAHGRKVGVFNVSLPPYSARWLYLFGASESGGLYVLSYRVKAVGSYSWGSQNFNTDGRLVAQNGSVFNWLVGFFTSLKGRLSGDRCSVAYGEGRMWAAGKMFLQGLATELDIAAGGVLTVLSVGDYGAVRLGAKSAAEAAASASKLAKAARALRVLGWTDLLAHGAALGYDAYLKAASGEVLWEDIASAAVLAAGPVVQRARAVSVLLAAGSGVMLFLGEPFDAAYQFSQELYSAAAQYGDYSDCFVSGALAAFSTYAQEAEVARWIGVVSTFVDLSRVFQSPG
ncbi:MAG: hypothetical protein ABWK05_06770, partial [Pyrobaculum sp.]